MQHLRRRHGNFSCSRLDDSFQMAETSEEIPDSGFENSYDSAKRSRLDRANNSNCQTSTGEYLLRLKTQACLSQSAIVTVVDATEDVIASVLGQLRTKILERGGDIRQLGNVFDQCCSDCKSCFSNLGRVYQQELFYRNHFHVVVSVQQLNRGSRHAFSDQGCTILTIDLL